MTSIDNVLCYLNEPNLGVLNGRVVLVFSELTDLGV